MYSLATIPALPSLCSSSNLGNLESHFTHNCHSLQSALAPFSRCIEHDLMLFTASSPYSRTGKCSAVATKFEVSSAADFNLAVLIEDGQIDAAIAIIYQMEKQGTPVNSAMLAKLLQSCAQTQSLNSVRLIQRIIMRSISRTSLTIVNQLASVYCKLGGTGDCHRLFSEMRRIRQLSKRQSNISNNKGEIDPKRKQAYEKVLELHQQMRAAGYVPDTRYVLHDLDEEGKQKSLMYHSERLAIAYGLISTPPGTTLTIMKNLRICVDCHNAVKFISKIEGRVIIVRDNKRFHHFSDGVCSCRDYW